MKIKNSPSRTIFQICNNLFLICLCCVMIYPMLYVIFASFSSPTALMAHQGLLLKPLSFSLEGYKAVARNPFIFSGYMVTIFVAITHTVLHLVMTTLGAYFFSRKNVMHQKKLMLMIVFTMYFSGGLVPTYLLYKSLGLENNLLVLILPGAVSSTHLIILRTAFYSIPDSLEESAVIDGAGHIRIVCSIMLPLILPTLAVIALYSVVGVWNSWFSASIYIRTKSKYPLQLILREILIQSDTSMMLEGQDVDVGELAMLSETIKYAVIVVATLPVLCIYPFIQKYFVKGTMIGAVKE